ncbi:MAG: hypothetical protein JWR61_1679 [Ferruginibacter sp.]|nr:hypothetical protein [Ferruginibacter sp.]
MRCYIYCIPGFYPSIQNKIRNIMKNNSSVQEILLLHNTRFLLRNWLAQKDVYQDKKHAAKDDLKAACWNGLVPEILPEIFQTGLKRECCLWDVIETRAFIGLNYSQIYPLDEGNFSIDPHIFMPVQDYN